jgi:hypothetical protein
MFASSRRPIAAMLAEFVLLLWMMPRSKLPFLGRAWLPAGESPRSQPTVHAPYH